MATCNPNVAAFLETAHDDYARQDADTETLSEGSHLEPVAEEVGAGDLDRVSTAATEKYADLDASCGVSDDGEDTGAAVAVVVVRR